MEHYHFFFIAIINIVIDTIITITIDTIINIIIDIKTMGQLEPHLTIISIKSISLVR